MLMSLMLDCTIAKTRTKRMHARKLVLHHQSMTRSVMQNYP